MREIMINILRLAQLIVIDGFRRHALIGLLVLAIACEVSGLFFYKFIPRDIGRAVNDFLFSIGWLMGFVFLFFHAVQVMAWDEERRTIHTLLARPVSRSQYVLAVFFGLAVLLLLLNLLLACLGWGGEILVKSSVDEYYFPNLSLPHYCLSWAGLYTMELIILAVILLFSGLVRGGLAVLILSLSYYLICNGLPVVRDYAVAGESPGANENIAVLLKGMTAVFPDLSRFDFKSLVASPGDIPLTNYLLANFSLMAVYVVIVLVCACLVYQRRDLK